MGEARGVAIGEAKGEAKGEARAITRILEKRFGKLPAAVLIRIASADITTMDRWIDRLDDATSLDAIFAD